MIPASLDSGPCEIPTPWMLAGSRDLLLRKEYSKSDGMSLLWLGYKRDFYLATRHFLLPSRLAYFDEANRHLGRATQQGSEGGLWPIVREEHSLQWNSSWGAESCQQPLSEFGRVSFLSQTFRWDHTPWTNIPESQKKWGNKCVLF